MVARAAVALQRAPRVPNGHLLSGKERLVVHVGDDLVELPLMGRQIKNGEIAFTCAR